MTVTVRHGVTSRRVTARHASRSRSRSYLDLPIWSTTEEALMEQDQYHHRDGVRRSPRRVDATTKRIIENDEQKDLDAEATSPRCEDVGSSLWRAEQARLRRRGESTCWLSVHPGRCEQCEEAFLSVRRRRYCHAPICQRAVSCAREQRWQATRPPADRRRCVCASCAREFTARRSDARLCGPACRQRARRHGLEERPVAGTFALTVTQACGL